MTQVWCLREYTFSLAWYFERKELALESLRISYSAKTNLRVEPRSVYGTDNSQDVWVCWDETEDALAQGTGNRAIYSLQCVVDGVIHDEPTHL